MENKKSVITRSIALIATLITLIVLIPFSLLLFNSGQSFALDTDCRAHFSKLQVDSLPIPSRILDGISFVCEREEVLDIDKNSINLASNLLNKCWGTTVDLNGDRDVFSRSAGEIDICFYCGSIKSSEGLEDFPEKLISDLKVRKVSFPLNVTKDVENLNIENIYGEKGLPQTLDIQNDVYYVISKKDQKVYAGLFLDPNVKKEKKSKLNFNSNSLEFECLVGSNQILY